MASDRAVAGELALQALEKLAGATPLGDYVYDIREDEGLGWDGPRVKAWSDGCALATRALALAGIKIR